MSRRRARVAWTSRTVASPRAQTASITSVSSGPSTPSSDARDDRRGAPAADGEVAARFFAMAPPAFAGAESYSSALPGPAVRPADDSEILRVKTCAADQRTIDVGGSEQLGGVAWLDAAAV